MLKSPEKLTAAFLAVFLMLGGTTSAEASELFTNSSMTGTVGLSTSSNNLLPSGWSLSNNTCDTNDDSANSSNRIGNLAIASSSPDGSTFVSCIASPSTVIAGNQYYESFKQSFNAVAGTSYTTSFYASNFGVSPTLSGGKSSSDGKWEILLDGSVIGTSAVLPVQAGWTKFTFTFTATSSTHEIEFKAIADPNLITNTNAAYVNIDGLSVMTTADYNAWANRGDPTTKADVIGSIEATSASAIRFSKTAVKTVSNRLAFLRNNPDLTKTSRQGIKVSFADPLIDAYVNGTQLGIASLGFDKRAAAEALTQVAANSEGAAASLSNKPVEVVMAEMKDIFGTVNLNPTAGALVDDWSVWTEGQITVGKVDATSSSSNQDSDSLNIAVGMDRDYGDLGLIGVALNIGQDDIDIGSLGSKVESDNLSLSFYNVKQLPNKLGLETQFGLGKMAIDTKRIDGTQTLTGERDATMAFGSISLRDEPLVKGSATITPYGRAEWAYIELDGYAETGGNLALNYDKQHINRYMLFLGSDVTYETSYANGKLKPFAAFEYGLDMTRDSDVGINYVADTTAYSTKLEKTATSNLMLRLGADYEMKDGVISSFAYERTEALGAGFSNSLRFHVNVPLD